MPDDGRVRADLARELGAERVAWDEQTLADHAHDTWPLALLRLQRGEIVDRPSCVVKPHAVEDVSRVLRYASRERVPVVPYGAGSGVCGGVLPRAGAIVVDMRAMNRLVELNETALIARVQAGMMGNHFEAALNERGYSMGHFPQSIELSTVGGWVATRAAGQFSTRYGSIEDMLLAFEAVLPDGRIVRTKAIPRRAAGPELRQLFLGAEGTLGIVTELTVRVFLSPRRGDCSRFASPTSTPAWRRSAPSCAPVGSLPSCACTTGRKPLVTSSSGRATTAAFCS
jgi:alkyldihydroxyacetonephosphate synthase